MLDERQNDGHTYRTHLENAARRGRKEAQDKLKGPGAPPELQYLLDWWGELKWGRRAGINGLEWFTWLDIQAWAALTERRITRREARALMMLDLASLNPD